MFTSTTNDTTFFAFGGAIDGNEGEDFMICKDGDIGTRSSYTKSTASNDSKCVICIRHTVSFNVSVNAALLYATVYDYLSRRYPYPLTPPVCCPYPCLDFAMVTTNTYQIRQKGD